MTAVLALWLWGSGPAPQAPPHSPANCAALRLHDRSAAANACYQALAASPRLADQAEGDWGLGLYDQANTAFRAAAAQNDASAALRVRWGRLLHERFNDTDADGLFQEALQRDPKSAEAYLGLALVSADGFDGKALESANRALELDPTLAEAHVLLATLALEDSDSAAAAREADAALAAQPDDLDAMAVHAAMDILANQPADAWLKRIAAVNVHYGQAQSAIARQLVLHRRYDEAVNYYRQAVTLDPDLWSAHSELGVTLMRLGDDASSRQELETAYDHDYRDAATVNSLRLLDSYKNFDVVRDGPIWLKLDKKESALLAPYFEKVVEHALQVYGAKYQMTLPVQPSGFAVQVEAYPNHDDFAVRSVGLPGLGALGVTFGDVVAMDSPSGRPPGDFNWASTLWHELDHVYVLTATHHLAPRWFAEGLAVHEETQANPEWGDRITPDVLVAIQAKRLLPVAELDRGFMHPAYPNQVIVSYYQAGRICDYIQEKWGAPKLVEMVHDFAVPTTTPAVIQQALGITPAEFDTQFFAWLHQQLGAEPANFNQWRTTLKAMAAASGPAAVIPLAEKARDLYPDYIYDANPYGYLAKAYLAQNDPEAARQALATYQKYGGHDPDLLRQLAKLEPPADAAATLDRINYIYPMDAETHRQLGDLWMQVHNTVGAVQEYTAVLDLHPLDRAGSEFHLAQAEYAAGNLDAAQDAVIASLVAAHDYRPAQDLLVKIMDAKKGKTP